MNAIVIASISATASIIVAIIGGCFTVQQNKIQKQAKEDAKRADARAEQRKRESLLAMEMNYANTKLTIGVAMALKRGHANGEIEEGLEMVNKASNNYNAYLREIANDALQE